MFTGDRSGEFLYEALYETGFASQAVQRLARRRSRAARTRTSPPRCAALHRATNPLPKKSATAGATSSASWTCCPICAWWWRWAESPSMPISRLLRERGLIDSRAAFRFGHNREHRTGDGQPLLISSYHPSQQNTSTGRLTREMLRDVFLLAKRRLGAAEESSGKREAYPTGASSWLPCGISSACPRTPGPLQQRARGYTTLLPAYAAAARALL